MPSPTGGALICVRTETQICKRRSKGPAAWNPQSLAVILAFHADHSPHTMHDHQKYRCARRVAAWNPSKNLTRPLLVLSAAKPRIPGLVLLPIYNLMAHSRVDCELKDVLHTVHLFAAAFHVYGVHSFCNGLSLLWSHRCETLCFQQVDACALGPQV